jgi:hypothetical protein
MAPVTLTRLTVEHLVQPLGLATLKPRFGWVLDAAGVHGVRQQAYVLEVFREDDDQPGHRRPGPAARVRAGGHRDHA